jgi:hypothetical protein
MTAMASYRTGQVLPTAAVTCAVTDAAWQHRQVALAYGFITGARTCRPQRRSSASPTDHGT